VYVLASCCSPTKPDRIKGYIKESGEISIHKTDCPDLKRLSEEKILSVSWSEIEKELNDQKQEDLDDLDYELLDDTDFQILLHHYEFGVDYSIVVADALKIPLQDMSRRHKRLVKFGVLSRVEKRMIQYRKNIVDGKWIKHRNHTYYQLTPKGERFLAKWRDEFFRET